MNVIRMNQGYTSECLVVDEELNIDTTRFFNLLKDFDKSLQDGCINQSKELVVSQMFTIKLNYGLSEADYDRIIEWTKSIFPEGNRLKENLYAAKSMVKPFDL